MKTSDRPLLLQASTQVCLSVGYAHSRGVIHRDLKPSNGMVGAFGEVQVMDWGLARRLGAAGTADPGEGAGPSPATADSGASEQTQLGSVLGTPSYMAPEQARGE